MKNGAPGRNRTCDLDSGGPRDIHFTTGAAFIGTNSSQNLTYLLAPNKNNYSSFIKASRDLPINRTLRTLYSLFVHCLKVHAQFFFSKSFM